MGCCYKGFDLYVPWPLSAWEDEMQVVHSSIEEDKEILDGVVHMVVMDSLEKTPS